MCSTNGGFGIYIPYLEWKQKVKQKDVLFLQCLKGTIHQRAVLFWIEQCQCMKGHISNWVIILIFFFFSPWWTKPLPLIHVLENVNKIKNDKTKIAHSLHFFVVIYFCLNSLSLLIRTVLFESSHKLVYTRASFRSRQT